MGVHNFSMLLETLGYRGGADKTRLQDFDCVLVDIQSIIYTKLCTSDKMSSVEIVRDVAHETYNWFQTLLYWLLDSQKTFTVFIAFDGQGLPMKFPIQAKRRNDVSLDDDLNVLKTSIFGNNLISQTTYEHFESQLALTPDPSFSVDTIRFVLSGPEVCGEGEHKLFALATRYGFKRPLVISVDNDVFLIAACKKDRFEKVQIIKNIAATTPFVYDMELLWPLDTTLVYASFLFGNDFVPEIVTLTKSNVYVIARALQDDTKERGEDMPSVIHFVVRRLMEEKKIRFSQVRYYWDDRLLVEYWKSCLWILDYYRLNERLFPQVYMTNRFFHTFNRNYVLTAFQDLCTMKRTFEMARREYENLETQPPDTDPRYYVFQNKEHLDRVTPYLMQVPPNVNLSEIFWRSKVRSPERSPQ